MYKGASASTFQLPKKGRYVVRAPESIPDTAFGATKAGYLSARVDPTIVGPTNEGFTVRFTNISAKPFERKGEKASQFGDYLKACGVAGRVDGSPAQLANAVEATAGLTYQADLDWRAYNKNTGLAVEGMEKFPSDGAGGHQPFIEDAADIDPETGKPRRLRANVVVTRFVDASTTP